MPTFLKFNKLKKDSNTLLNNVEYKDGNIYFYNNEIFLDESSTRNQYGITVKQNESNSTFASDARPILFTKHTISGDSVTQNTIGALNSGETEVAEYNPQVLIYPSTNNLSLNNLIIGYDKVAISYDLNSDKITFSKGVKANNLLVTGDSVLEGNLSVSGKAEITGNLYAANVNSIHYVVGNSTDSPGTWTATCNTIDEYFNGLTIAYKVTVSGGSSSTTLNITNKNGTALGVCNVKTLKGNLSTHAPVGTIIHLTYCDGVWYWGENTPSSINASGNKMYLLGAQTTGEPNTVTNISTSVFIDTDNSLNSIGLKSSGNILISKSNVSKQSDYPSLQWGNFNNKTYAETGELIAPFIGYAGDQSDGTFLLMSMQGGSDYRHGLAIGATSGKLLWQGTEVATITSTVANAQMAAALSGNPVITIGETGKVFSGTEAVNWSLAEIGCVSTEEFEEGLGRISFASQEFIATAGATTFTITSTAFTNDVFLMVFYNGLLLKKDENYSYNNKVITLGFNAEAGDLITAVGLTK